MIVVDAPAARAHLPFDALIGALRDAFARGCEVPLRHTHRIDGVAADGAPQTPATTVLLMPAWRVGGRFGVKTVAIAPGNAAQGLPGLHASYLLADASTGVPLAIIDGDEITARRTAAASALAASFLARPDAAHLVVVGGGRVAALLPEAMRVVRPIGRVSVWTRRAEAAEALVATLRAQGFDARAVTDLEAAVRAADIVSCATLASVPVVHGAWLGPGSHLDLIGSFAPAMRESDAACFCGARVWVDTPEALAKSGDVLGAIAEGAWAAHALQGTLAGLCAGADAGRRDAAERTVFKSVGTALEDLAAAELVYDALQRGR